MPKRPSTPVAATPGEAPKDIWGVNCPAPPRPEVPPSHDKDGRPNPEHWRARMARINVRNEWLADQGLDTPRGTDNAVKNVKDEFGIIGLDEESMLDSRPDYVKIRDEIRKLLSNPAEIFASVDATCDLLERAIEEEINDPTGKLLEKYTSDTAPTLSPEFLRRGKEMLNRLQRVRRLRAAARLPFPKKEWGLKEKDRHVWEASHVLRYMIYTGRSGTIKNSKAEDGDPYVYMIGPPHVKFAVDTWIARTGVLFEDGEMKVGGCRPKMGVMLIAPPGHGKSDFAAHYLALEIGQRPRTQSLYVHAVVDMAEAKQTYVAALFSANTAAGRRHLSLFPSKLDKSDNNKTKMRLKLPERAASPTITACGMTTAKLGADSTFQVFDDIVPQSDVDQPTERARRFKQFSGTFATRQRGLNTFKIIIGTMWHPDDALSKMWKISLKTDMYVLSKQATGGPVKGKKRVFEPIWPEVAPERELRRRFDEMNRDISLWSANYMGDPIADEARIIKKIAFYDPQSLEHQDFLNSGAFHVSVDPTATNKETSDKAGLVYAATGEVPVVTVRDGGEYTAYQTRMRILETQEIHANQVELVDRIAHFTLTRPVYQVHIECRSGFHATADILQNKYNIDSVRHDPGNKDKSARLKQCAGVIDASLAGMSPLIEFPGERKEDGSIGPCEAHKELYSQLLDFGYSDHDHLVDAITQLGNWLLRSGILVAGFAPTDSFQPDRIRQAGDPRIHAMLDEWAQKPNTRWEEEQADWKFIQERNAA